MTQVIPKFHHLKVIFKQWNHYLLIINLNKYKNKYNNKKYLQDQYCNKHNLILVQHKLIEIIKKPNVNNILNNNPKMK